MKDLRELRLWHYRRGLFARRKAQEAQRHKIDWEQAYPGLTARAAASAFTIFDRRASFHEGAVRVLDAVVPGLVEVDHGKTPLPKQGAQPR